MTAPTDSDAETTFSREGVASAAPCSLLRVIPVVILTLIFPAYGISLAVEGDWRGIQTLCQGIMLPFMWRWALKANVKGRATTGAEEKP